MANAAAEGAAIADGQMCDIRHYRMQYWKMTANNGIAGNHAMAYKCANVQPLASLFDPVESRNTVNVDQNGWADHAEIHHWKQTLPARDDFAFSACLGKCRHRFIDGLRENIVQGDRFHIIRP